MRLNCYSIFLSELEDIAIDRIRRYALLAEAMNLPIEVGFSGGKDSQVVYDLCQRSGIQFTAYFNHAFESNTTLKFIREHYPDVVWRRYVQDGFFRNAEVNHQCMLPTVRIAYCCADYKHNPNYAKNASITGVRREESSKRRNRKVLSYKNKSIRKHSHLDDYFTASCMNERSPSPITLNPIIDWTEDEVWQYIYLYNLPINPEYNDCRRVGCMVCPKANFRSNYFYIYKYPKLIDCAIFVLLKKLDFDWYISSENRNCSTDKFYYICRWLNHSFMPFTQNDIILLNSLRYRYNSVSKYFKINSYSLKS